MKPSTHADKKLLFFFAKMGHTLKLVCSLCQAYPYDAVGGLKKINYGLAAKFVLQAKKSAGQNSTQADSVVRSAEFPGPDSINSLSV